MVVKHHSPGNPYTYPFHIPHSSPSCLPIYIRLAQYRQYRHCNLEPIPPSGARRQAFTSGTLTFRQGSESPSHCGL